MEEKWNRLKELNIRHMELSKEAELVRGNRTKAEEELKLYNKDIEAVK